MKPKVSQKISSLAKQLQGKRSEYTAEQITSPALLAKALTNYGLHWDSKVLARWLLTYLADTNHPFYPHFKAEDFVCKDMTVDVLGKIARLVHYHKLNQPFCNEALLLELIDKHLIYQLKKVQDEAPPAPKPKMDFNPLLQEFEEALDYMCDHRKPKSLILQGTKAHIKQVIERATQLQEELKTKEGRECYDKDYRELLLAFIDGLLTQYNKQQKAQPTRQRTRKPSAIVSGVRYLEEFTDGELHLKSKNPVILVASHQLILYNKTTKQIHLLKAERGKQLSAKGCLITNVCMKTSYSKTLKQPH